LPEYAAPDGAGKAAKIAQPFMARSKITAILGAMMRGSSGGGVTLIDNFSRREEAAGIFGAPFRVGRQRGLLV